jgi:2-polyprenyl-3-methyl-5-hydroxy-6-metoxy-1,4-benzoquinol methylase
MIEEVNKKQKEFYENKSKNIVTKIWSYFRNGLLNKIRQNIGVQDEIYQLHKRWLGDLSNKKVLDLGCYEGNSLSYYLASSSAKYIGVDLSEKGINILNKKFESLPNASGVSVDFLSSNFEEKDFDIIYAYGVLHHFQNTDNLINKLKEKLKPEGKIISYDPLQTSLPIKFIRTIYRPFQTDRAWEWPFTKKVYYKYQRSFEIVEKRAILGKTKWFFLINLLPFSHAYKQSKARELHLEDWEKSSVSEKYMFKCMHLTMLMHHRPRTK